MKHYLFQIIKKVIVKNFTAINIKKSINRVSLQISEIHNRGQNKI